MELLNISNLRKVYRSRLGLQQCVALQDISLTIAEGEFVAIMGASGSGKTTLLNLVATLDRPTTGDIQLDGRSFLTVTDRDLSRFRRENLGFVFQDFNLLDSFTLRDNILLPLVLARQSIAEMDRALTPVAQLLRLDSLLDKYPYEVSGGEKQRAAVARAIITQPRLLLADEPTGALDSRSSAQLLRHFRQLNEEAEITILMVTHSIMAASYARRVLFIQDGRIQAQLYRGDQDNRAFFERIAAHLTTLETGGGQDA